MKMISLSFDQVIPHIMIATAAASVFVVLGFLVFLSVVIENWHEARKKIVASRPKTLQQAKREPSQNPLPGFCENWDVADGHHPIAQG